MVYLDLSQDFIAEMNAGSLTESLILQSVQTRSAATTGGKMILTLTTICINRGISPFKRERP
jgi:hypothetical protein